MVTPEIDEARLLMHAVTLIIVVVYIATTFWIHMHVWRN